MSASLMKFQTALSTVTTKASTTAPSRKFSIFRPPGSVVDEAHHG